MVAAVSRDTWVNSAAMVVALVDVFVPNFWIAILSVILFSVTHGWLPSAGHVSLTQDPGRWLAYLLQPAVVLAIFQIGDRARMTRSAKLDVLDQDCIRTAKAKGLSARLIVLKHAFRNALMQVVTASGDITGLLVDGSVVIEQIFALPGIAEMPPAPSRRRIMLRRLWRHRFFRVGGFIVAVIVALALAAPLLTDGDPNGMANMDRFAPP